MEMSTIMVSIAKFFRIKLQLFLSKGYKIKVGKKSYLLFEKEEHYEILIYLERVFFDLFRNILFINDEDDEHKKIRVFFRMTLIEKYVKKLPVIKIKIFYDKHKCKNPFEVRFPILSYLDYDSDSDVENEILENLEDLRDEELEYMIADLTFIINEIINVKYYK